MCLRVINLDERTPILNSQKIALAKVSIHLGRCQLALFQEGEPLQVMAGRVEVQHEGGRTTPRLADHLRQRVAHMLDMGARPRDCGGCAVSAPLKYLWWRGPDAGCGLASRAVSKCLRVRCLGSSIGIDRFAGVAWIE